MKLRSQMLLAGLLTLTVPLVGWQSVKQLYVALQQTRIDDQTLKAANMRLALSESDKVRQWLAVSQASSGDHDWYAEASPFPLFVDGYDDDWQTLVAPWSVFSRSSGAAENDTAFSRDAVDNSTFSNQDYDARESPDNDKVRFRVATHSQRLYLFIQVKDNELIYHRPPFLMPDAGENELPDRWHRLVNGDAIEIAVEQAAGNVEHGLFRAVAPGSVTAVTGSDWQGQKAGEDIRQWQGFWSRTADGYQLEVSLPLPANGAAVALAVVDVDSPDEPRTRSLGLTIPATMANRRAEKFSAHVLVPSAEIRQRLVSWTTEGVRARVFDARGWLVADVNRLNTAADDDHATAEAGTFNGVLEALMLRVFASMVADDLPLGMPRRTQPVLLNLDQDKRALLTSDTTVTSRYVTDENDRVLGTLGPLGFGPERGYLLLESNEEHSSAYAGNEVARLFGLLLLVSLAAGCGLLIFALVLSSRIRRLSQDTQQAISVEGRVIGLAGNKARDEIGDLSRNLASLLSRSAQYTQYLEALSARLSHELRTPLSVVRTSLQNLELEKLDAQSQQLIDRAEGGANQLGRIIKALLDSTRLEQSVEGAAKEPVNLGMWLHSCVELYRQIHPAVEFSVQPESLPQVTVKASPELLQQALDKLVDNAISFSSDNQVRLFLKVDRGHSAARVLLAVGNRGDAINDTDAMTWFDPLVSRREQDSTGVHLGLGLYMVRLIARASGGDVFVRHNKGWVMVGLSLPLT